MDFMKSKQKNKTKTAHTHIHRKIGDDDEQQQQNQKEKKQKNQSIDGNYREVWSNRFIRHQEMLNHTVKSYIYNIKKEKRIKPNESKK